jgi:hypothetical protein
MHTIHNLTRLSVVVLIALSSGACADDDPPVATGRVLTTVNVSVGSAAIEVGEITGAKASGLDQDGAPMTVGTVSWASDDPGIAAVNVFWPTQPNTTFGRCPDSGSFLLTAASTKEQRTRVREHASTRARAHHADAVGGHRHGGWNHAGLVVS